jgi:DNA-binding MarR family transcriptional regulator
LTARRGSLALDLLLAADWMNDALLARLRARGWPPLMRSHALVFAHLQGDVHPAGLARRLGITRQSTQALLDQLIAWELVRYEADPADARRLFVRVDRRGRRLLTTVRRELDALESTLAERIGARHVEQLRTILALDWGDPPTTRSRSAAGVRRGSLAEATGTRRT